MGSQYLGCALCEVDANGNILLPEPTAKALGLPAQNEPLLLAAHERDQCLVGYARSDLREIQTRTERWQLADESADRDAHVQNEGMRRLLGIVEVAPRSDHGLRLPEAMRNLGRIESVALVVGAGDRFEIWNPQLALAQNSSSADTLARGPAIRHRHAPRAGTRRARPVRY